MAEAKGEVDFAASFIEWYAAEGRRNYGEIIEFPVATSRSMVRKEPIGVAGIIVPVRFTTLISQSDKLMCHSVSAFLMYLHELSSLTT